MKNKILVVVVIPEITDSLEMFIPVNERVGKIVTLVTKYLGDNYPSLANKSFNVIDPDTGTIYDPRMIIRDTNIKASKRILFF